MRPLVSVGGTLFVVGSLVVLGTILSGAFSTPPVPTTVQGVVIAALAAASFGAGCLLVVLLTDLQQ